MLLAWTNYVCTAHCASLVFPLPCCLFAAAVGGTTTVAVSCTPSYNGSWPGNSFKVNVTASGQGDGCPGSGGVSTGFDVVQVTSSLAPAPGPSVLQKLH